MSYDYNGWEPTGISLDELDGFDKGLLRDSKTFCIYPWIHLHTYPTGETYPCCHANMQLPIGSTKDDSLETLWNSDSMKEMRNNMIKGCESKACKGCYEQEKSGFFSGRKSANKHHGHHIKRVDQTYDDGRLDEFKLTYWDTRFSNLCNLSCRSCGHIFSSSWYKDQIELTTEDGDPNWKLHNKALNVAGKFEDDMLEQLMEHIDDVEQIYFAGGEPLMMKEHYMILDELEKRERFDVRLIYNTNFTVTKLKDRDVFSYWKKFSSVSVGASLDADGYRAEYIRKGTDWEKVVENRKRMMLECPNADFYISATLSIMNAMHLPDFHESWVEMGLIEPQDFNINILQFPSHYRLDIGTKIFKEMVQQRYDKHIRWLKGQDPLNRATTGYESALNFMWAEDNSDLIDHFFTKVEQLDIIRGEYIFDYIPELEWLNK